MKEQLLTLLRVIHMLSEASPSLGYEAATSEYSLVLMQPTPFGNWFVRGSYHNASKKHWYDIADLFGPVPHIGYDKAEAAVREMIEKLEEAP